MRPANGLAMSFCEATRVPAVPRFRVLSFYRQLHG